MSVGCRHGECLTSHGSEELGPQPDAALQLPTIASPVRRTGAPVDPVTPRLTDGVFRPIFTF